MRILHLNTYDTHGGAARDAYRLHRGLLDRGIDSRMLVGHKMSSDPTVEVLAGGRIRQLANRAVGLMGDAIGLQYLTYPASFRLLWHPWYREADVLQLHNLHDGYFNPFTLLGVSRDQPVVLRLADMWSFTGHCSYSYDSDRWKSGCGSCPYLDAEPALPVDTSHLHWSLKKRIFSRLNLGVVAPSGWMASLASRAPVLAGSEVHHVPSGVDSELFRPLDRQAAREALDLPADRPVLMFGAVSLQDERKGGDHLRSVLHRLASRDSQLMVLLVGNTAEDLELPVPARRLGWVSNDRFLAQCYSASDLFLAPTLADNLPNAVLESLACGTPVVAFDVGGVSDAVRHLETGWLAEAGNVSELAEGIGRLLADDSSRERMGEFGRRRVQEQFQPGQEVDRFLELYGARVREKETGAGKGP